MYKLHLQDSPNDCGAACLATILHFHGLIVTPVDIVKRMSLSRAGATSGEMNEMASYYGLQGKLIRLQTADFDRIREPCVAYVRGDIENMGHNVVIFKVSGNNLWIGDPARGKYKTTRRKFEEIYTGLLLIFRPGPDFEKGVLSDSYLKNFLRFVKAYRLRVLWSIALGLVASAIGFAIIYLSKLFVDLVLPKEEFNALLVFVGVYFGAKLLNIVVNSWNQIYQVVIKNSVAKELSERFFGRIINLEKRHVDARDSGDFLHQFSQIEVLTDGIARYFGSFILVVFGMLVKTTFLVWMYDPLVVGLLLIIITLNAALGLLFSRVTAEQANRHGFVFGQVNTAILNSLNDIRVIRLFQAGAWVRKLYQSLLHEGLRLVHRITRVGVYGRSLADILNLLAECAIFLICGLRIMQGSYTVGDFLVFFAFAQGLANESNQFPALILSFQTQLRSFARVQAVLALSQERGGEDYPEQPFVEIEFKDVSFGFTKEAPVLAGISAVFERNKTTAIVGESGSGKTTLINLAMGFYQPNKGAILVNGMDLNKIDLNRFRGDISAVLQDTSIFNKSIYQNASFGKVDIPLDKVARIARTLGIDKFVEQMPRGYKTLVYQGGLSGGQTQRIGILRAMCKDFKLLIMDEATSQLDSLTEEQIIRGIGALSGEGKTRVIIAHRLSTVMAADRILVMKNGRIVEVGTHHELVAREGYYLDLIQRQYEINLVPPPKKE